MLSGDRAAFSPDLKRLASAGSDNTVKVWDAQTGQALFTCKGHTTHVWKVAFSPDGKRLASSTIPGRMVELKLWDAQTGQELPSPPGRKGNISSLVFSPERKRLACAWPGVVKVWDAQTGQEILSREGTRGGPYANVAFSPDGKRLAHGGFEVKVWDVKTGQELHTLMGSGPGVAFSWDGKRLAGGGAEGVVRVWDLETRASGDGTVTVWDAQNGQEMLAFTHTGTLGNAVPGIAESHSIAFSADGHRLASAFWDGTVKIWDATPLPAKP
jgi:WD40 repeat protein